MTKLLTVMLAGSLLFLIGISTVQSHSEWAQYNNPDNNPCDGNVPPKHIEITCPHRYDAVCEACQAENLDPCSSGCKDYAEIDCCACHEKFSNSPTTTLGCDKGSGKGDALSTNVDYDPCWLSDHHRILPESAVEVSPGVFYLGESMDKGKVVEGYVFIHYVKPAANSKPVWDETVDIYKLMFGGIRWLETIKYDVNLAGSNLEDDENYVKSVLETSMNTWDDEIPSFDLFGALGTTHEVFNSGNGTNTVTWDDLGDSGIIAANYFWFYTATKEMIESDVRFNLRYTWSISESCADNAMDLQSIATHEFGHNGLNDLYMPKSVELTMHGYSGCGETEKRDLGTGDISGIQELYGE